MRIHALISAILLGAFWSLPGLAEERLATSFELRSSVDPSGTWRVIGRTGATSDCIGETITPICAVETHLACFDRRLIELCRLSDPPKDFSRYNLALPGGGDDVYRIDKVERVIKLTPMQRRFLERDGDKNSSLTRIGDVTVHMRIDECAKNERACGKQTVSGSFCLVRQSGKKWQVIDCAGDGVDDF